MAIPIREGREWTRKLVNRTWQRDKRIYSKEGINNSSKFGKNRKKNSPPAGFHGETSWVVSFDGIQYFDTWSCWMGCPRRLVVVVQEKKRQWLPWLQSLLLVEERKQDMMTTTKTFPLTTMMSCWLLSFFSWWSLDNKEQSNRNVLMYCQVLSKGQKQEVRRSRRGNKSWKVLSPAVEQQQGKDYSQMWRIRCRQTERFWTVLTLTWRLTLGERRGRQTDDDEEYWRVRGKNRWSRQIESLSRESLLATDWLTDENENCSERIVWRLKEQ